MKKIVYLPLDERPCNYDFARRLLDGNAEFRLVAPDRNILGLKKTPADFAKIARFLADECKDADILVLSVDMLLYGGIVPSRLHALAEGELKSRLSLVRTLKAENARLKIYAFALIMRCPSYSSDDEEPAYYAHCGREIFLTGQIEHKLRAGLISPEEYAKTKREYASKTAGCLDDFLARRNTNLNLLYAVLDLAGEKIIDYLVIPQDDSAPCGYTAMDRARVDGYRRERGIFAENYPGADEVGMALTARAVNEAKGASPKVAVYYAAERGKEIVPLYEDRPLRVSVKAQIRAAGCQFTADGEGADLLLFVNVPSRGMADIGGEAGAGYRERNLPLFAERMARAVNDGKAVLAADVAYCNGGDAEWVKLISEKTSFFSLGGYAGWNTSSNTLGTVVAQGVLFYHYGNTPAHRAFLAERAYEDVGYCGHVRGKVCGTKLKELGLDWFHTDGVDGEIARTVKRELTDYLQGLLPEVAEAYKITNCTMPWSRMFEVALTVESTSAGAENKNNLRRGGK